MLSVNQLKILSSSYVSLLLMNIVERRKMAMEILYGVHLGHHGSPILEYFESLFIFI